MELSPAHQKIIRRLADGHFLSGQQLADELGVSRASVWNYLKALEDIGFEFHAVKGKGTRLKLPIELLDKSSILSYLSGARGDSMKYLELLDICPSTNQFLAQQYQKTPLPNGAVCMAEMQTMGKGRLGKTWVSPYGQNIYLSFLWNFKSGMSALSGLSLACGVAVCRALEEVGVEGHGLKWPNDILWQGKKMGGILVEIQGESQGGYTAIVGIGLNYRMDSSVSSKIEQPWVDVSEACGDEVGRNQLAASVIDHVLDVLSGYESTGLTPYVEQWNRYDCYRGKVVRILSGNESEQGVANGISSGGELRLLKSAGNMRLIMSGEVSLRLDKP